MFLKRRIALGIGVALLCGALARPASATTISYQVSNVGGNTWEYAYTVANDTLAADIEEFSVVFDLGTFENLAITNTPSGWDALVLQSDLSIPADGLYDVLALGAGIAPGDSLGGFLVRADFLGVGIPGAQPFQIVDPFTFSTIDSGRTVLAAVGPALVPEPTTLVLLGSGLLGAAWRGRRKVRSVGYNP